MKQAAHIADAAAVWIQHTFGVSVLVQSLTQDEAGYVIEIRIADDVRPLMERAVQVTEQSESI